MRKCKLDSSAGANEALSFFPYYNVNQGSFSPSPLGALLVCHSVDFFCEEDSRLKFHTSGFTKKYDMVDSYSDIAIINILGTEILWMSGDDLVCE